MSVDERDRCMCGALVPPHDVTELRIAPGDRRPIERGSCRSCGLQLVRSPGDTWRHIRG